MWPPGGNSKSLVVYSSNYHARYMNIGYYTGVICGRATKLRSCGSVLNSTCISTGTTFVHLCLWFRSFSLPSAAIIFSFSRCFRKSMALPTYLFFLMLLHVLSSLSYRPPTRVLCPSRCPSTAIKSNAKLSTGPSSTLSQPISQPFFEVAQRRLSRSLKLVVVFDCLLRS